MSGRLRVLLLGVLLVVVVGSSAGSVATAASPVALTRQTIDQGQFAQVTHVNGVGDLNGDGSPDLVVGGNQWLVWFAGPTWTPHLSANGFDDCGS